MPGDPRVDLLAAVVVLAVSVVVGRIAARAPAASAWRRTVLPLCIVVAAIAGFFTALAALYSLFPPSGT